MHTDSLLSLRTVEDVTVVSFQESTSLDTALAQQLSADFERLVEDHNRTRVLVDLGCVEFLSSSALSVLMSLRKKIEQRGGLLMLCGLDEELRKVFKITNLDRLFTFGHDRDAALKELGAAPAGDPSC